MKLKSLIVVGILVFAGSCSNQAEAFRVEKFYPLGAGCDVTTNSDKVISPNGYLDVAAGSPQFFVGVKISGADKIQQPTITLGTGTLESKDRNRPIINQTVVTYRLSRRIGPAPKPYIVNTNLPFSEAGIILDGVQLISPELATTLFDGLSPSPGTPPSGTIEDFVDITCDVEFKGEFSTSRSPFTTGVLSYPIRAYRSNPVACPDGFVKFPVDKCEYVGQSTWQLITPEVPSQCCTGVGPAGGAGC